MILNHSTDPWVEADHSTSALEINEVTKVYGRRAVVDKVSFVVERGEIFGLVGPNGSGKTTTIRMALDIIRPDAGRVSLLGGMPTRDALMRIGYLPEERGLYRKERVLTSCAISDGSRGWLPPWPKRGQSRCSGASASTNIVSRRWNPSPVV